jgi:hypothetical protein
MAVHKLFLTKCDGEHLRKLARVGIKDNEASDVAEAGRERAGSAAAKKGERKLNPLRFGPI